MQAAIDIETSITCSYETAGGRPPWLENELLAELQLVSADAFVITYGEGENLEFISVEPKRVS